MRRICLALPTHRSCGPVISAVAAEAAHAARTFAVEVTMLVLDSADPVAYAGHAAVIAALPAAPGVHVVHLDEAAQQRFLSRVTVAAEVTKPDLVNALMLPDGVSYGACTNRAFLIAAALGCESVHRRDSDFAYQRHAGAEVFPIDQELRFLGRPAAQAATGVTEVRLAAADRDKPVVLVGGSFVGDLSVDIDDVRQRDPQAYHDIVSLWAPEDASARVRRDLVAESFTGAGTRPFSGDHTVLDLVDPMRVDMCNISFHQVQERVPLPPMTETIGSDYFLIHLVRNSRLPGVLHNRHIVNFHTPDRRALPAFLAYQLRLAKFFLSMHYLHVIYRRMAQAGEALLDERHRPRSAAVAGLVRDAVLLDRTANVRRLHQLDSAYRRLGGRYTAAADRLAGRRDALLAEVAQDFEDFAVLIEAWGPLIRASRSIGAGELRR
ncbi:DUF6271 family protein [Actinoplanes teichomyceticus]|uniref:Uncharacterized protein n=1 Tax=Actinoplanes teichomyceticus TaxID=1867 RepID=A0A561WKQ6_ACTTI|nr:DUF6271 family protein [Actinoplanes teichomyceticus]TWG24449.1 hypothetical protein FHX34_1021005 [Actinoplanes teichomyceticus]GIF12700.1 hypothetical protein Ate01nite_27320 [Actinoplanes teichomyceticus]